ncbi:DUF2269 family protein [Paenibacillus sp. URB8-2]|uniref:DUF2269 family protein n=1 Tax=Paenibacillus sp. URB8-2 TaxID=2741301 RepID=UPI0015C1689E|nr:DUF2269 family protein [Paenibacillus sp. URB8-2]BCG57534.1 hypothetical protein PUR_09590 [Paenibacillus sp. URB8-2]
MYIYVLFVHIAAAVMGLGAAFAFPLIAKSAKTVSQAKFVLSLLHRLEILPKVGSILLLLTGIAMAILEPSLFKAGWFIASIVIYLAVQVIVVGILPKQMNKQLKIVNAQKGENLPESYKQLSRLSAKWESVTHAAAFLLILLMVFKPF